MKKLTPAQRRLLKEEAGVLPMSDSPMPSMPDSSTPPDSPMSQEMPDENEHYGHEDLNSIDPYAKHMGGMGMDDLDEASAEGQMKVERIGAGLKKISKAAQELENAMAILKSERSDYSRGKALIDIRQELSGIITQIKTELINMADHEPGLANKVRDIINEV